MAVDSFSIDWSDLRFYAFPPFSCIDRCLQKIYQDKAVGILVVPDWPNQPWYPVFLSIVSDYISFPSRRDLLHQPNRPEMLYPSWDRIPLSAALVYGEG